MNYAISISVALSKVLFWKFMKVNVPTLSFYFGSSRFHDRSPYPVDRENLGF